jgi:hypothetical protein
LSVTDGQAEINLNFYFRQALLSVGIPGLELSFEAASLLPHSKIKMLGRVQSILDSSVIFIGH